MMMKADETATLSSPITKKSGRELSSLIRTANLTIDEFLAAI